jgi:hypothetical protein
LCVISPVSTGYARSARKKRTSPIKETSRYGYQQWKDQINPRKGFRYKIASNEFFVAGCYQNGDITPDTEYSGNPDRPGPQRRDPVTGLLVWKLPVTDPAEPSSKRRSYDVLMLSDTEPVPPTQEIAPGVRPVVLTEVTVEPRLAGQGEFKYLSYTVRALGFAPAPSAGGRSDGGSGSKSAA